jgi:CBS domain-containing protein
MKIEDVMTREVVTVRPDTSLKQVAALLAERRISGLPVVGENGEIVGVVSEGDILFKERGPSGRTGVFARLRRHDETKAQLKLEARTAAEAMTAPARTTVAWRSVSAAAAQMLEEGVNRLPVVDKNDKLVGIVTRADLVRAFARSDADIQHEIQEDVLERTLLSSEPIAVTVAVADGKVTLGGSVDRRMDAELVSAVVAKVPGVVEVESAIAWRENGKR